MKKFLALMSAAVICTVCFLCGCVSGRDGVDGKDGSDVSIYEIYQSVNEARAAAGEEELEFLDFIEQYLSYTGDELTTATSLQAAMNRSLLSSVSIFTNFTYKTSLNRAYNLMYSGTGVIIDVDKEAGDAYIVTNCHVIYSSSSEETYCEDVHVFLYGMDILNTNFTVTSTSVGGGYYTYSINDGDCGMTASVVAASITYDIALLKVEDSAVLRDNTVYSASFSEDDIYDVGQSVYAVGNSGGYGLAVTTGIISKDSEEIELALDDSGYYERTYRVMRTDAALNSGCSGGGLFDANGNILGIVNSKSGDDENTGYALPASTVKRVIASMLYNEGSQPVYGVYGASLDLDIDTVAVSTSLNSLGIIQMTEGASVAGVENGGASYGILEAGDIITHIKVASSGGDVREDMDITRVYLIDDVMLSVRAGDTVTVTVKRSGEYIDKTITYTSETLTFHD